MKITLVSLFGLLIAAQPVLAQSVSVEVNNRVATSSSVNVTQRVETTSRTETDNLQREEIDAKKEELRMRLNAQQQELRVRQDEMKERIASRQAEMQERMEGGVKERIKSMYSRVVRRLIAAVGRLDNLLTRIDTRAEKIAEETGADNESVKMKVSELKIELKALEEEISSKSQGIDLVLESDDPRTMFVVLKVELEAYWDELKDLLTEIRALIIDLETLQ